jgi:hypothetical protein
MSNTLVVDSMPPLERILNPTVRFWLIISFAIHLIHMMLMTSIQADLYGVLILIIALPGIILGWTIPPYIAIVLTALGMLFTRVNEPVQLIDLMVRPSMLEQMNFRSPLGIDDLLISLSLLACVASQFRVRSLSESVFPKRGIAKKSHLQVVTPRTVRLPGNSSQEDELFSFGLWIFLSLVAALVVWAAFLLLDSILGIHQPLRTPRAVSRLFLSGLLGMSIGAIVNLWYVRQETARWSRSQAQMFLRDQFQDAQGRELDRIHRWKAWFQARKNQK